MARRGRLGALALALVAAACGGDDDAPDDAEAAAADPAAIVGVEWQLVELVLDGDPVDLADVDARLRFDGQGTWTADACNSYGGPVRIAAGTLTAHTEGSTLVGCQGATHVVDNAQQALMSGEVAWSLDGDELRLAANGVEATYVEDPTPFPSELEVVLLSGELFQVGYDEDGGRPLLTWEGRDAPGGPFGVASFAIDRSSMEAHLVEQDDDLLVFSSLPEGTTTARYGDVDLPVTELPGGLLATAAFVDAAGDEVVALDASGAELGRSGPLTAP